MNAKLDGKMTLVKSNLSSSLIQRRAWIGESSEGINLELIRQMVACSALRGWLRPCNSFWLLNGHSEKASEENSLLCWLDRLNQDTNNDG